MKLCAVTVHVDGTTCVFCWPLLRYPQPLSPRDAEYAVVDMQWEPRWRPFAVQLARQMRDRSISAGADLAYRYWSGVYHVLHTLSVVADERALERGRGRRAHKRRSA